MRWKDERSYSLNGTIKIDYDAQNPKKEKSLYACSAAISDVLIEKNEKGQFSLSQDEVFRTKKNVEVERIYLMEGNEIQNCNLSICSENEGCNIEWNGKPFQVDAKDKIGVDLTFCVTVQPGRNDCTNCT